MEACHSMRLLSLFFFSVTLYVSVDPTSFYEQQVIVILDDDLTIQHTGRLLYQRYETRSHVLKWNKTAQVLEQVEWNEEARKFEACHNSNQELRIGDSEPFSWSDTSVQVLGLGEEQSALISGFSAEELANLIVQDLSDGDVGHVSVITTSINSQAYLNQFMTQLEQLQQFQTRATLSSAILWTDHSGRELAGEIQFGSNGTITNWRHASPPIVWIGYFTEQTYQIEQSPISADNPPMKPPSFGVLPEEVEVHVTNFYSATYRLTFEIADSLAFAWVDLIAEKTYNNITNGRATAFEQQVQFLSGSQNISEVFVIKIENFDDFMKELHYYGNKGPTNDDLVYYSFGDWVLSMNETSFNVRVEGIIVSHAEKSAQVDTIRGQWQEISDSYPEMQQGTSSRFFDDIILWINGEHSEISLSIETAYNAQCGVAIFLSESIRSFHAHITNMMSLDLAQTGYLTKEYFFSDHPMAQEGTWQIEDSKTGKRLTGLNTLRDGQARAGALPDQEVQQAFDASLLRVSRISKSWLSHIDDDVVMGSRYFPPAAEAENTSLSHLAQLLSVVQDIGSTPPGTLTYLRVFELTESANRLLSSNISDPELGAIDMQLQDFLAIDHRTLPLQASTALVNDHAYFSNLIIQELSEIEQQTGKKYEIVQYSVKVSEEDNIVKSFVRELGSASSELQHISTDYDPSKLQSKALLEKLLSLSNKTKPIVTWYKRGEALYEKGEALYEKGEALYEKGEAIKNTMVGMMSSIHKLENGLILEGAFDLAENANELNDQLTVINKAASEFLGKALKTVADKAGKSVAGSSIEKKVEDKVLSLVGNFENIKAALMPVIGALFNNYKIYEDFNSHSVIGYIDGAFDIASTVLAFFGPEGEGISAILSIIKAGVDYFYTDISKEIQALPSDASVGQVVVAVLKGIAEGVIDILKDVINNINIFSIIGNCHKLDEEYNRDRELLREVSDYSNYYNLLNPDGSNDSEIDFAGSGSSWNGGDIEFHLGEDGQSYLKLKVTNPSGGLHDETHNISTGGVEDIVMGIGETHTLSFQKKTVTAFWIFPVDSRTVISGIHGEKQTLHGTYYGNSHNNKFIAVQELPPNAGLGYNLQDYHYTLYGGGGNDSFYLGPQPTYVEGNEGSDTYFINSTATITEINSHSGDGQHDTMIINLNYSQLTVQRVGIDLSLTSLNGDTHNIVLHNWFHDVTHQRVVFKTGDGVLFKVSATITKPVEMIAYALSGSSATQSVTYDARLPVYSEVFVIAGSEHDDTLYGNDLDNQINGAGGSDTMTGGEGQDTYHIDLNKGVDIIDNFALNGDVDTLIISTDLDELIFSSTEESNDLYIARNESHADSQQITNTGAIIKNWFLNESYRHLTVVTNDQAVIKVSATKTPNASISYQHFVINMTKVEEQAVENGDNYTRLLDLNSSPDYSEVTTVTGTSHNDTIIGNGKNNYISGGRGFDFIEGREGADTYVVRKGDGSKTISNCANDTVVDSLLFDATFDDIRLSNTSNGSLTLSGPENITQVILNKWFQDTKCQHLLVRSADGITFTLPNTTLSLTKTPKSIDNSNLTSDTQLVLAGQWVTVEHVIGSKGDDQILGNSLDNYIDPGVGNSYLEGGNGSDTYIIRSTYGEENIINNYAVDNQADTIYFLVPYLTIRIELEGMNVRMTSLSKDGLVGVKIIDYNFKILEYARHLVVITSDGITFVLPVADTSDTSNYKPIPVSINMAQYASGQHLNITDYPASGKHSNITDYPDFSEVRTVYGAIKYQNTIVGNSQSNTLVGGIKQDYLQGLDGDDTLKGGDGDDVMEGGRGMDILVGGDGNDTLDGGEDDDVIAPGSGANQVNGGEGTDTVLYSGDNTNKTGIDLDLGFGTCEHDNIHDTLNAIENAYGTEYDDILTGDDSDNVLVGKGGNDTLAPGTGYDLLNGGNGSDIYDLTDADGTVTIDNFAADHVVDLIVLNYVNLSGLWYEIAGDNVVIRVINSQFPVFYDGSKPAVVLAGFMKGSEYQHANLETADGIITNVTSFINSPASGLPATDTPSTDSPSTDSPSTDSPSPGGSSPASGLPATDTPSTDSSSPGTKLYFTLGIVLAVLGVFVGFVVLGAYKRRSEAARKQSISFRPLQL